MGRWLLPGLVLDGAAGTVLQTHLAQEIVFWGCHFIFLGGLLLRSLVAGAIGARAAKVEIELKKSYWAHHPKIGLRITCILSVPIVKTKGPSN